MHHSHGVWLEAEDENVVLGKLVWCVHDQKV